MNHAPAAPELLGILDSRTRHVDGPGLDELREHLLTRHGDSVEAILFYGSCLRTANPFEGLVDLYVVPRDYRHFYASLVPAVFNWLLPPNVYYLELDSSGRTVRSKYAVVSRRDFRAGTSRWFHSYLWGRFTQPVAFLYYRDERVRRAILSDLAQATVSFLDHALPRVGGDFTVGELWTMGLALGYRAELRAERPDRVLELFKTHSDYYRQLTRAALPALAFEVQGSPEEVLHAGIPRWTRRVNRLGWGVRIPQGKLLSVLRLLKALFTFHGGMDYILWKIERHSGISVEPSPFARRHPLLGAWGVFWRLYRRGAFR